jgi:hypothetical protein
MKLSDALHPLIVSVAPSLHAVVKAFRRWIVIPAAPIKGILQTWNQEAIGTMF